ncbi:MAG TPA: type II secretion system F family protein [Candidatus Saccharimonadales bacterium]|nr:type II secretion system F family protein [Candidatus Saccharimonadales bacterium]
MLTFNYSARDQATNKIIKSTVQAESERAAAKLLLGRNLTPLKISIEGENKSFLDKLSNHVSTKDKVIFTRQLATLINAGLPLAQSLHTVQDQTTNKRLKVVVQDIISSVEGGSALAKAFAKHPDLFNEIYVALIAAGEVSGTLDKSLERIADQQEKDAAIASKIRGAMVYPLIVVFVMIGVVVFMLTTVVPQIKILYDNLHKELPTLTAVMVASADFLVHFWWLIIIVLFLGVWYLRHYAKTPAGIRTFDTLKINMPLFGDMFKKLYMARFARTGETLLISGVQMLEMLRISSQAVGNVLVAEAITRTSEKVKSGKSLASSLKNEEYILPLVYQMISIGEQSGGVDAMMGKAASFYENELDDAIKAISTSIEPILMVLLAVVAGGMVGAILFPVYNLSSTTSLG